jgi:hypothetical protein
MPDRRLYSILTLTGAAPFVAAAVLPLLGYPTIGPLGPAADLALSYGLAIVCFLSGVHWATWLYLRDKAPFNLFAASNAVVLGCWFPYLLAPAHWTAVALIAAFAFLLFVDVRLRAVGVIDDHYLRIRTVATALAVASLTIVAVVA